MLALCYLGQPLKARTHVPIVGIQTSADERSADCTLVSMVPPTAVCAHSADRSLSCKHQNFCMRTPERTIVRQSVQKSADRPQICKTGHAQKRKNTGKVNHYMTSLLQSAEVCGQNSCAVLVLSLHFSTDTDIPGRKDEHLYDDDLRVCTGLKTSEMHTCMFPFTRNISPS